MVRLGSLKVGTDGKYNQLCSLKAVEVSEAGRVPKAQQQCMVESMYCRRREREKEREAVEI